VRRERHGLLQLRRGIWGCGFRTRNHRRGGNVAYISHSGSGMCGIVDSEERIDFNLVVSTGQELAVSMDEYLDFALEMPGTRAVGLFMETARNPEGLVRAFAKARERGIPVVALKVGRTELSAQLTVSHSGAIAGRTPLRRGLRPIRRAPRARHGRARDDAHPVRAAAPRRAGGLVSIHDSGGERQLLIDLAEDAGVPLPALSRESTAELESLLDPGLPAVNPLDAWSTGGPEYHVTWEELRRPHERPAGGARRRRARPRAGRRHLQDYLDYLRTGHRASGKPAVLVSNRQGSGAIR
jgi:acyl-CoA synthetase (NDP forming)